MCAFESLVIVDFNAKVRGIPCRIRVSLLHFFGIIASFLLVERFCLSEIASLHDDMETFVFMQILMAILCSDISTSDAGAPSKTTNSIIHLVFVTALLETHRQA